MTLFGVEIAKLISSHVKGQKNSIVDASIGDMCPFPSHGLAEPTCRVVDARTHASILWPSGTALVLWPKGHLHAGQIVIWYYLILFVILFYTIYNTI